jgi:hypothetical protein
LSAIERLPRHGRGWHETPLPAALEAQLRLGEHASCWLRRNVVAISTLELAELPDGSGEVGPQWHLSISSAQHRATAAQAARALEDFGLVGAEEDNHEPGIARHFWLPVDPARRRDCECKESEVTVVEPDGHRWTNPREGEGECRGCEYEAGPGRLIGRGCPLHPEAAP